MADRVMIGQYVEAYSLIHRLDPRTKLISLLAIMLSFLFLDTLLGFLLATILAAAVAMLSRTSFLMLWKVTKPVLLILTFTFVYNALFTEGWELWSWAFIHVTEEGLRSGARIVWRIVLLIVLASILTFTTKPLTLAQGLQKLLSPLSRLHVPVEQFSLMIVIAIRFIPTIVQELDRILLAQKARGLDRASLSLMKRIRSYIPILVPLLFTTIQRAEQLSYAIDARAYGSGQGRTSYYELRLQKIDVVTIGITALMVMTLLLV